MIINQAIGPIWCRFPVSYRREHAGFSSFHANAVLFIAERSIVCFSVGGRKLCERVSRGKGSKKNNWWCLRLKIKAQYKQNIFQENSLYSHHFHSKCFIFNKKNSIFQGKGLKLESSGPILSFFFPGEYSRSVHSQFNNIRFCLSRMPLIGFLSPGRGGPSGVPGPGTGRRRGRRNAADAVPA